jgi:hypothetical protein
VLALVAAGCGGGSDQASGPPLSWVGKPKVFKPAALPTDRVVVGTVRNTSGKVLHLSAAKVIARDAAGKRLISTAQFAAGYAHGLYGAYQKPSPVPPLELQRLGLVISLAPGKTAPLAVSWRIPKGARLPISVDYGAGRLVLPTAVHAGAPGVLSGASGGPSSSPAWFIRWRRAFFTIVGLCSRDSP